jgi:predicted pyridoxine 5'-phosphate oxidase superfamily flavin-nucleotide-binding protein
MSEIVRNHGDVAGFLEQYQPCFATRAMVLRNRIGRRRGNVERSTVAGSYNRKATIRRRDRKHGEY